MASLLRSQNVLRVKCAHARTDAVLCAGSRRALSSMQVSTGTEAGRKRRSRASAYHDRPLTRREAGGEKEINGLEAEGYETWMEKMPTRAIGKVLLDAPKQTMDKQLLFDAVDAMGMLRSYRQYRHCLKMMLEMKRVQIFCMGPVRIGSKERRSSVVLTVRGTRAFEWHREQADGNAAVSDDRGLKDAL